jgi:hypothetical protein
VRYALTFLGKHVDEKDVRRASQTTFWGTDEGGIAKAARRYGCEVVMRNYRCFPAAFRSLIRYVQSGQPCVLCVDRWMHWVAVAGANRNGVALFDPKSVEVATLAKPEFLRRRWAHRKHECGSTPRTSFSSRCGPGSGIATRSVVDGCHSGLRRREELRGGWDRYLRDLVSIFDRDRGRTEFAPAWRFRPATQPCRGNRFGRTATSPRQTTRCATFGRRRHGPAALGEEKRALVSLACILNREAIKPA